MTRTMVIDMGWGLLGLAFAVSWPGDMAALGFVLAGKSTWELVRG